MHFHI